jgi:hypothetical protein
MSRTEDWKASAIALVKTILTLVILPPALLVCLTITIFVLPPMWLVSRLVQPQQLAS